MKKVLWSLLGAVIVLAALFFVFFGGEMLSNQLKNDSVVVTVELGDGTIAVASELSEKGVIKREKVFRAEARSGSPGRTVKCFAFLWQMPP